MPDRSLAHFCYEKKRAVFIVQNYKNKINLIVLWKYEIRHENAWLYSVPWNDKEEYLFRSVSLRSQMHS